MDTSEILKKVRQIEIQTGKLVAETFAGEYLSVFKGQGIEFAEVREYTPGDDVRTIDWNVTARSGSPYIKKFNEERELTLLIACDVSASEQFGSFNKFKNEAAAELSALFAFSALKNSDKVGLYLFSDQTELFVPPKKGRKHILRLIRELLAFQPKSKKTDIGKALETLNKLIKRQGILILISDFLEAPEEFEKPFRMSAKKFDLIPVIVKDPLELKLPRVSACVDVKDPETGEETFLCLSDKDLNRSLDAFNTQHQTRLRKLFNPYKIDPIIVDTGKPTADPVIAFFKQRNKKLRR